MTFRDYYLGIKQLERPPHPAKIFIAEIAELTERSPKTINQWLSGCQHPSEEVSMLISKKLGIPPEELFPQIYTEKVLLQDI